MSNNTILSNLSEQIGHIFGIPNFLHEWLDRFFEPEEFQLILALGTGGVVPLESIEPELFSKFERAYTRGVLNKDTDGNFEVADFHTRFELWALFEGWKDVPSDIQQRLNAWELDHYTARKSDLVENLKQGRIADESSEYVLLHEAEALLDDAEQIYLWPCNCRAMMQRCTRPQRGAKPVNVCLRFSNERGIGWEISAERAKSITREANRKGLMQLHETNQTDDGSPSGGLCNCCSDCCFPHLAAERLNSQKMWPTSRYVAEFQSEQCSGCGKCVRRCPFQAFETSQSDQSQKNIIFIAERCRGCGVCATGCPETAIRMNPL